VAEFKYLERVTNQNCIHKEIRADHIQGILASILFSLSSSYLLPKNLKIKIYRNILLVVSYGCETWSLTLREDRLRMFVNRVLRRVFGPKRE